MPFTDELEEVVTGLRTLSSRLEDLDFWPPQDAANTIVATVTTVVEIASQPPEPDPAAARDVAAEWRRAATDAEAAGTDLTTARETADVSVWEGEAGSAYRRSLGACTDRLATVPVAARGVATALDALAEQVEAARTRHGRGSDRVRQHLSITWKDLLPWELVSRLKSVVGDVLSGMADLIAAYGQAAEAARACRAAIVAAMDAVELPDHLPDGVPSVIDVVNEWDDDDGPLDGSTLSRFDEALAGMSPSERADVEAALAGTDDPAARAWIVAAVAGGLTGAALQRYVDRIGAMSPSELADLDPSEFRGAAATQPDQTTCGSSALVMSRMENNPAYALWMQTGYDPETGLTDLRSPEQRFADEAQEMHDRTNARHDREGNGQIPYPEAIGTQPWAVAAEMSAEDGSGVPGTDYGVSLVDPTDRGESFDRITSASEDGHTVPVYIGDQTRPGHIVLVTGSAGGDLSIYDPARGETVTVSRDDWAAGRVDIAGWQEPWAVVVPAA